ncbi:Ctr domain-containing protein, partial [Cephalotus follicularis]
QYLMMMMMHMTFFWGKNTEILFSRWPGTRTGMYVLALVFIFVLSLLVEWLSHCKLVKPGSKNLEAGVIQTFMHAIRVGLAYLVMLAVMSFNVGVLLVAIAGHGVGFFLFGSRAFKKTETLPYEKHTDLPSLVFFSYISSLRMPINNRI